MIKKQMIHIKLAVGVHRALKMRAASEGTTIQKWVSSLIGDLVQTPQASRFVLNDAERARPAGRRAP